ncbi:AraC family transcriptional regulator [Marinomonas spartinae]|uniref:AraC family transcriptional regulator n=1 Tax=Marinomonas spartinae TaxID=1792290 RepID=UPI0018F1B5CB|nr:helix-turn-helix domain-containing protein [Marinomonas spartinae]MBJ7553215.1 helix-turn-helix domain-containing protein [Marinomonas spartinae]
MRDSIEIMAYSGTAQPHEHHHTQIVLPLEGALYLEVEKTQRLVKAGQACLISNQHAHHHFAEQRNRCLVINNLACWNKTLESDQPFIQLSEQAIAYLPFLSKLSETGSNPLALEKALSLIEYLLPIPKEHIQQSDQRVLKAKYQLDRNFDQPYLIQELADAVHLSQSQLTILFKRYIGMTPKQYLLTQRLNKAKQLLIESNKSLDDIAHLTGMQDASALVKLFSKHLGKTPGQYRAQSH